VDFEKGVSMKFIFYKVFLNMGMTDQQVDLE
jgi:hypothetical protein